jgi:ABC-type sulfate/molybdate transport systems ATPase subunit
VDVVRATGLRALRGGREVLKGVDLELREGELVALLGPRNAGKSTLLGVLSGLLPAAAGTLERRGDVLLVPFALARRTGRASLELWQAWAHVAPAERAGRIDAALSVLDAAALADRPVARLSAGERRRILLAGALASPAAALLLDEPFAGAELRLAAAALRERTTLFVVHDAEWVLADRALVLLHGRVAAAGPPRELLERPPSAEVASVLGLDA